MLRREISGLGLLEVFIWFLLACMVLGVVIVDGSDRAQYVIGAAIAAVALFSCHRIRQQRRRQESGG